MIRGLKNHTDSLKTSVWFFDPCGTILVAALSRCVSVLKSFYVFARLEGFQLSTGCVALSMLVSEKA